ncbi:MAG: di-heme oxidoredictase family protein, partial [Pyrinomonadaceae bacterium]
MMVSIWVLGQSDNASTNQITIPRDPGIRGGPPRGGGPLPGIQVNELKLFNEGKARAEELEATCNGCSDITEGGITGENPLLATITNSAGLGARFNGDQCIVCHSQPVIGGAGGFLVPNPGDPNPRPAENPMSFLIPNRRGQTNRAPSFITPDGPIREARFKFQRDARGALTNVRDGGVHQLFTLTGRNDDPTIAGCNIAQPDFERELREENAAFRIPLTMEGTGFLDSVQDKEVQKRHDDSAPLRARFGILGVPNRSGNDGTITRFGWKAQNKSITVFAGEAYNVEMGVTNELFPQAVEEDDACNGPAKPHPNDVTRTDENDDSNAAFDNPIHILADWMEFMLFMRFLEPPPPGPSTPSTERGRELFTTVGCAACHTPEMRTAPVMNSEALQDKVIHPYS